ncbi:MAG: hypothetical protein COY81_02995 [Candidatus Pacebacteria bacterium CG_4_10_14_0_8_um_filter_43_12]|nr:MAG: hypothetical protein COY81_02995 [Candidatus Pacebacteria bacterium CG_4_10_14_0_8_um_filter_43_12]
MNKKRQLQLLISVVLIIVFGTIYFLNSQSQSKQKEPSIIPKINQEDEWQEVKIDEIGLTLRHPKDLIFRKEIADDNGRIRTVGFFLTKGAESNPEYQMYGLYQQFRDGTQQDLEMAKKEMDSVTIKEATIGSYSGIEGLIVGPKTRHITIVLKDGKLFSVSTAPPTQENKELTEKIMATLDFE